MPNIELVNKILHSLPLSWEPNVTAFLEAKDLTMLWLVTLLDHLSHMRWLTLLMIRKEGGGRGGREDRALKASSHQNDDDDLEEEEVLSWKFKWFLIRRREGLVNSPKHETYDVIV